MNEMPVPLTLAQTSQTMRSLKYIQSTHFVDSQNQAGNHLKKIYRISGPGDKARKLKLKTVENKKSSLTFEKKNTHCKCSHSLSPYFISSYLVFQILGLGTRQIVKERASNPGQHDQSASESHVAHVSHFCV